jgi:ubiquitin C-terminal hydrolase
MNATLQALSNTKDFTKYFLNDYNYNPKDTNKNISNEFYKLLNLLWDKNKRKGSFSPNDFKETLSKENPLFKGIQSNDAKDLITFLLEKLHTELNQPDNSPTNGYAENQFDERYTLNLFYQDYQRNYKSMISNLFYGVIEIKNQCTGCNYVKFNFQIFNFLEFPLEQVNKYCFSHGKRQNFNSNNKNPDIDLYECFEYNCNIDLMAGDNQMYCNICNSNQDALYGTQIYSAPNYLIINLNRGRGAVYECKVIFPEKLNLLNFITFKDENTFYELYAVICHLGPSSMSGHFVAYCKKKKDEHYKWYLFNDAIVTECQKQEEFRNGMPYILFYKAL